MYACVRCVCILHMERNSSIIHIRAAAIAFQSSKVPKCDFDIPTFSFLAKEAEIRKNDSSTVIYVDSPLRGYKYIPNVVPAYFLGRFGYLEGELAALLLLCISCSRGTLLVKAKIILISQIEQHCIPLYWLYYSSWR